MILSKALPINETENAGQLHDRLMEIGSQTVIDTLERIATGNVATSIQKDTAAIKTAYKLNRENCKIDWSKSAIEINNLIRGLSPYPAAWCFIQDKNEEWNVKIYEATLVLEPHDYTIGSLVCTKKAMKIAAKNGFIQVLSLQFPGKKKMNTAELLNGITFSEEAKAH
jgi:methionyl-tRNA formyltransferase